MAVVPVDVAGSIAKGMQVNQLRQQMEAQKAATQEKNAMRSLYAERFGGLDPQSGITWQTGRQGPAAMTNDQFAGRVGAITGDAEQVINWQKHFANMDKAQRDRDAAEAPFIIGAMRGVQDQAGYDRGLTLLRSRGIDTSDFPQQYNRETANLALQGYGLLAGMKPESYSAGSRIYDPITNQELFSVPSAPGSTLGKLIADRDALPQGDPRRAQFDAAIRAETQKSAGQSGPFGGTSLDAQAMNILLDPNANTSSPAYVAAYNHLAQPRLSFDPQTGRQIVINPDMTAYRRPAGAAMPGAPVVPGAMPQQPAPAVPSQGGAPQQAGAATQGPGAGVTTQNVAPPRLSFQEAQAVGSLQGVSRELAGVESLFFPNGQYDRNVAVSAGDYGIVSGVPFTEGRTARQSMRRAIEVILRTRTGAAAPDSEVDSYMEQFFPSPADTDEQARAKFRAAQNFVNDTYQMFGGTRDLPSLTQPQPQQGAQPGQGGRKPPPAGFVPF